MDERLKRLETLVKALLQHVWTCPHDVARAKDEEEEEESDDSEPDLVVEVDDNQQDLQDTKEDLPRRHRRLKKIVEDYDGDDDGEDEDSRSESQWPHVSQR